MGHAAFVRVCQTEDQELIRHEWRQLDSTLRVFIASAEEHVFPALRILEPLATSGLMLEHEECRSRLREMCVLADLHALNIDDVEALVRRVRELCAQQAELLFPWSDEPKTH